MTRIGIPDSSDASSGASSQRNGRRGDRKCRGNDRPAAAAGKSPQQPRPSRVLRTASCCASFRTHSRLQQDLQMVLALKQADIGRHPGVAVSEILRRGDAQAPGDPLPYRRIKPAKESAQKFVARPIDFALGRVGSCSAQAESRSSFRGGRHSRDAEHDLLLPERETGRHQDVRLRSNGCRLRPLLRQKERSPPVGCQATAAAGGRRFKPGRARAGSARASREITRAEAQPHLGKSKMRWSCSTTRSMVELPGVRGSRMGNREPRFAPVSMRP